MSMITILAIQQWRNSDISVSKSQSIKLLTMKPPYWVLCLFSTLESSWTHSLCIGSMLPTQGLSICLFALWCNWSSISY